MNKLESAIPVLFVLVIIASIGPTASAQEYEVPNWFKGIAGFWSEGRISDEDFKDALMFLIDYNIVIKESGHVTDDKDHILEEQIQVLEMKNTVLEEEIKKLESMPVDQDYLESSDDNEENSLAEESSSQIVESNTLKITINRLQNQNMKFENKITMLENRNMLLESNIIDLLNENQALESKDESSSMQSENNAADKTEQLPTSKHIDDNQRITPTPFSEKTTIEQPIQEQTEFYVTTDKIKYLEGDTIIISGYVGDRTGGYELSTSVRTLDGRVVAITQTTVEPDKTFEAEIQTGPAMEYTGWYKVLSIYGDSSGTVEFYYDKEKDAAANSEQTDDDDISVTVDKARYLGDGTILINGHVSENIIGMSAVHVSVESISGDFVSSTVTSVDLDKTFDAQITVREEDQAYKAGDYKIAASGSSLGPAGVFLETIRNSHYKIVTNYGGNSDSVEIYLDEPVFATQNNLQTGIVATVDKERYTKGDTVRISGHVDERIAGIPVYVYVESLDGNFIFVASVPVGFDNGFSAQIRAGEQLIENVGDYNIRTQYKDSSDTVGFYYDGSAVP